MKVTIILPSKLSPLFIDSMRGTVRGTALTRTSPRSHGPDITAGNTNTIKRSFLPVNLSFPNNLYLQKWPDLSGGGFLTCGMTPIRPLAPNQILTLQMWSSKVRQRNLTSQDSQPTLILLMKHLTALGLSTSSYK